jgi:hypothetical protein
MMATNLSAILVFFIITFLANIWFNGALIFNVFLKKGFDEGLRRSRKFYIKLLGLSLLLLLLHGLALFFGSIGFIIQIIINWVFLFSFPAIIIKKDNVETSLIRSYDIVRKNIIGTFIFWLIMVVTILLVLFLSLFFFSSILVFFLDISTILQLTATQIDIPEIIVLVLNNYHIFIIFFAMVSFSLSVCNVFSYLSRTYYFLKISRKFRY